MHQLNNLDVILLIITAISALIALYRGLTKEVLSIIGWILAAVVVFYLLPLFTPFAKLYIANAMMAGFVTALIILIVFYIIWLLSTDRMIGKIRTSKLNTLDRMLGLLFGLLRAFLLVILFNILITWMLPDEAKSGMFKESRYFTLAGTFAEPFEKLIPQSTIDMIKDQSAKVGLGEQKKETEEKKEKEQEEKKAQEEIDALFEQLAQPKIEKINEEVVKENLKDFDGYKDNVTDGLDRLIENTVE